MDETYIQNGSVRIGYIHFVFLGEESYWAAEASECAAEQDAFWEYHDYLFDNHGGENQGAFSQENLTGFATELGLDTDAFSECLQSGRYTELVQAQTEMAGGIGVRSTPTFLMNGQGIVGAQPYEVFQQAIDNFLGQ
ncbi:MAG: thioredoxin domain-containing protein [Anaerolineales bacterium]|nr:thioredoxin domain-containing protein [Anaerolineales bacterium]